MSGIIVYKMTQLVGVFSKDGLKIYSHMYHEMGIPEMTQR